MLNRLIWCALVVFAGLLLLCASPKSSGRQSLAVQQNKGNSNVPVLDYETEIRKAVSEDRKEKNKRFNAHGNPDKNEHIAELPEGVEPLPTISHWWIGMPALPVSQSVAVVLGEVTEAEAHLSGDKTGIYSEFSVRVDEVFKDVTGTLGVGVVLPANRVGGAVRFASGKVQKYQIGRQGMPQKGRHYVLFLKQVEGGGFLILTGYELFNERVTPLDGEDSTDPRSALPFAQYKGVDQSRLLQDLRTASSRSPSSTGPTAAATRTA